jgi:glycosyltransferase involved in cell wall biosynthesis
VSVIIPVFNGERYLAQALRSVLAQEHRPLEVIVVDDGSTDDSAAIARSHPGVRVIEQSNRGVPGAWNRGLTAVSGELIGFLAQDDLWTEDKLAVQVPLMVEQPQLAYTIGMARYFLETGCVLPRGFRRETLGVDHVAAVVETLLARREAFERVGVFNPTLPAAWEVDWFSRARDAGLPTAVVPRLLLHRRIHDDNLTFRALDNNNPGLLAAMRRSLERKRRVREEDPRADDSNDRPSSAD